MSYDLWKEKISEFKTIDVQLLRRGGTYKRFVDIRTKAEAWEIT